MKYGILTHGGASSSANQKDGTDKAAHVGLEYLQNSCFALDAVVKAVEILEDDSRFNAGTGSVLREDGRTVQMDAACMDSSGKFGAVAAIERVKNPILVARKVMDTSAILLAGEGATHFAHQKGVKPFDVQPRRTETCVTDTVGAIAYDGETFACALSSGGLTKSFVGRVGDVPLYGCGLFCGPLGAVAATGDGEDIAKQLLAHKVYGWLCDGIHPKEAAQAAVQLFSDEVDVGIIIITPKGYGTCSKSPMAWSVMMEKTL